MGENSDDNDPFEEDIVFDQSGLLTSRSSYSRQQMNSGFIPTFMLFIRTVFLCVAFIGLGLCSSVGQGPLIHLEVAVGIPTEKAFHSFTAHCIGMFIGGLLGSSLFEIYNRQFLIFVSLMWMSFSISVLPFTIPVSYWWTLVNLAALGVGLAFLFTGSNVLCLDLWGKQGGASLQSLHFSFAVGAFIAPIIIQPFISGTYPAKLDTGHMTNLSVPTTSPLSIGLPTLDHRMKRELVNISSVEGLEELSSGNDSTLILSNKSLVLPNGSFETQKSSSNKDVTGLQTTAKVAVTNTPSNSSSPIPVTTLTNSSGFSHKNGTNSSNNGTAKAPKPKPSFTNANLIPEHSKWDRPAQKESMMDHSKTTGGPTTQKVISSTSNTSINSTPAATTLSHDTSLSTDHTVRSKLEVNISSTEYPHVNETNAATFTDPSNYSHPLQNDTERELTTPSEIMNTSLSTTDNSEKNVSVTSTLLAQDVDATLTTGSYAESGKLDAAPDQNTTPTITKVPIPVPSFNHYNENTSSTETVSNLHSPVIKSELIPPAAEFETSYSPMFVIDYSNHSDADLAGLNEEDLYADEFVQDSFSDYAGISSAVDRITKEEPPQSEPEVLDLKENPGQEDEVSTIAVTASFPSGETTQHHHHHHVTGHQSKPGTFSNISDTNSRFFENLVERFRNYGVTSIHFVYICVGVFLMLNAFVSVVIMCHNPREPRSKQEDHSGASLQRTRVRLFFGIFSLYMFMAEALQGAIHHLLASTHTENGLSTAGRTIDGAAIFWGLVCATRFLCILVSGCLRVRPSKILVVSTFLMVLGTILLCIGTFDKQDFLWGGIVIVAIGLAPVLPTSFLWMAELMRVTHRMCALMIVISSFGNSLTHTTLTHVLANSHLYAYILIGISVFSMVFLCIAFCLLIRVQNSKSLAVPVGYQLANQEEEEALELTRPTPKNFDTMSRRLSDMGEAGQALLID